MDKLNLFIKASRFQVIPVMIIPIILGALGAYAWKGTFHPWLFAITLLGAGAAHLFSNMINDLWDYRNSVEMLWLKNLQQPSLRILAFWLMERCRREYFQLLPGPYSLLLSFAVLYLAIIQVG